MQSNKMKFRLIMTGYSADFKKMSDFELAMQILVKLATRLHMKGGICPGGIKLNYPDPKKIFVGGGVASYSLSITLKILPGRGVLQLQVSSTRGLKGFGKVAEKIVREAFDLSSYKLNFLEHVC